MRIVETERGARILSGRDVVSDVLKRPGPTHTVFDAQAACIAALAPGPRVALLGFGGGALVAPLRAMGFDTPILAVDRWRGGTKLFRRLCGRWAGSVRVVHADIARWLRRGRRPFDLILEDIAPSHDPRTPGLIRGRLVPGGIAVVNTLSSPKLRQREVMRRAAAPFARAVELSFDEYENRMVVCGRDVPPAAKVSRLVRDALASIGSRQAQRVRARSLR